MSFSKTTERVNGEVEIEPASVSGAVCKSILTGENILFSVYIYKTLNPPNTSFKPFHLKII